MGVGLVGAGRIADLHVAALRTLGISLAGLVSSYISIYLYAGRVITLLNSFVFH